MTREIKFRAWDENLKKMLNMEEVTIYTLNHTHNPVMQYTGLKDKNGKEIYEGDIVYLAGYGNYSVEFPFGLLYESSFENDIGEIIGNIYENPELLKLSNTNI